MATRQSLQRWLPALGVVASACVPVRYTEAFVPDAPVVRVVLEVERGSVEVVPGGSVRVERAVRGPAGAAALAHHLSPDGTLTVEAGCPGVLPCGVDTRLSVPPSVPVAVAVDRGDVWVTGLEELQLDIADGDADVEVGQRLVASLGTGSIRAWLGASTHARVAVGQGNVDVQVPASSYDLDLTARTRDVEGVLPDGQADGHLEVIAPAGRARVRGGRSVARR